MTPTKVRRAIAAVVGGTSAAAPLLDAAEAIGHGLANAGMRVATGGRGGVMTAASRGAAQAPGWFEGCVIGVLPSLVAEDANPYVDIAIPTGLNYARNTVLVAMADVVIAVGGGAGTLSEIALAWQHNKPIVAVDMGDGWSAQLAGTRLDPRRDDHVHRAVTAAEAVQLATQLAQTRSPSDGF